MHYSYIKRQARILELFIDYPWYYSFMVFTCTTLKNWDMVQSSRLNSQTNPFLKKKKKSQTNPKPRVDT